LALVETSALSVLRQRFIANGCAVNLTASVSCAPRSQRVAEQAPTQSQLQAAQ